MPETSRTLPEITVCTPWYPTAYNPVGGSFVADWAALSRRLATRLRVIHAEEWPGGTAANVARWAADTDEVFSALAGKGALDVTGRFGTITRVPTVITGGWDVPRRAEAAVEAVRRYGGPLRGSPVVHGHVGYLGGLAGARLAAPDARLVVTEHSTGLRDVLDAPAGLALYDEVLQRAHRLTCVSKLVREQILAALPHHADKVVVVPNPVNFHPAHRRRDQPQRLDRWVYAGGLIDRKGVVRLVEAFCGFAAERPAARLDMFGQGVLEAQLRNALDTAGLTGRVTWHGNVTHGAFLAALPSYDVLLAPSRFETFHLVVPEAVAAGLPVVVTRSGGPEEALHGVADQVGRFVDVNDDAEELLAAVLDLEAGLGGLDLDAARATLEARYGPDATTARLAELYAAGSQRADDVISSGQSAPTPRPLEGVTLLSALGWRRYALESEATAARDAGVPTRVVTTDPGVRQAVPWAVPVAPRDFLAALGPVAAVPAVATGLWRTLSGAFKGRRKDPAPPGRAASAQPERRDTYVLTHVSGAEWAAALLRVRPDADVVLELDRPRLGLAPVDA